MALHCICVLDSRHAVRMGRNSSTTLCCDTVREKKKKAFWKYECNFSTIWNINQHMDQVKILRDCTFWLRCSIKENFAIIPGHNRQPNAWSLLLVTLDVLSCLVKDCEALWALISVSCLWKKYSKKSYRCPLMATYEYFTAWRNF